jgi:hypothetical protein
LLLLLLLLLGCMLLLLLQLLFRLLRLCFDFFSVFGLAAARYLDPLVMQ